MLTVFFILVLPPTLFAQNGDSAWQPKGAVERFKRRAVCYWLSLTRLGKF